jgi:hypothetical protein
MTKEMNKPLPEANCKMGNYLRGGRLGETCETMDKKRIKGRRGATSWHHTAKSPRSRCPGGKSDVCAGKHRVLTWGDPAEGNLGGKSAEVIVGGEQAGGVESPV